MSTPKKSKADDCLRKLTKCSTFLDANIDRMGCRRAKCMSWTTFRDRCAVTLLVVVNFVFLVRTDNERNNVVTYARCMFVHACEFAHQCITVHDACEFPHKTSDEGAHMIVRLCIFIPVTRVHVLCQLCIFKLV